MITQLAVEALTYSDSARPAVAGGTLRRRTLSAELLSGVDCYRELQREWTRLAEVQSGVVLFQTPEILQVWSQHFAGQPGSLATIVVRGEDGRPVLIWPLLIERNALVRIARGAGSPVGQYDEILLDPDCNPAEAWEAAVEVLMRTARPDLVLLERVRADGPLRTAMGAATPLGAVEGAPYSDLSAGVAKLIGMLKPRVVKQQKKRVRRFEAEGVLGFEVAEGPERAEAWLTEAIALKREWLRSTGRFSRAFLRCQTIQCLVACARSLSLPGASPRMVVSRLTLDGRTAAVEMGFCHRGTYHLYLGAFAPGLARFGPGNILTEKLLNWCAGNGIARYDMLAPRSRNKAEWQSGEVEVADFALPTTVRGRLYVEAVLRHLLPAMRRAFYALPDPVRSALAGLALRNLARRVSGPNPSHGSRT